MVLLIVLESCTSTKTAMFLLKESQIDSQISQSSPSRKALKFFIQFTRLWRKLMVFGMISGSKKIAFALIQQEMLKYGKILNFGIITHKKPF